MDHNNTGQKNMIKQTVFAISQDQTKPILMGERFKNGSICVSRYCKTGRISCL